MHKNLLFSALFLSLSTGYLHARTWTNSKGQKAKGELISATKEQAIIQFDGKRTSTSLSLDKLSELDRKYVEAFIENGNSPDDSFQEEQTETGEGNGKKIEQNVLNGIPDNFDSEWPKMVKSPEGIEVELVREDQETKEYVYHSPHYEFICDVPLKSHLVKKFAVLFEGTREVCRELPISTKKAHISGDKLRHQILLFESKETYFKNGGPPGSAGVFIGDVVMVPLTSLGVKKLGSSYTVDYGESNKTLPHELAHQLTDRFYYAPGARGWFSEGLAEYVAVIPYRSGTFMVSKALRAAKVYATEYRRDDNGGRALGEDIKAPPLKSYMLQDYGSFTANGNFNYGLGLLITTYFFEIEEKGNRTAINAFLKALREGKTGEKALESLLQGRSYNELAADISKGWKSRGVKIEFADSEE